jgi:tRNA pseudouridine38-40 synthase
LTRLRTFYATVAYDGTAYGGWQFQANAISVQQRFEESLTKIEGYRVPIIGSGRTDSGVHAEGQGVSFTLANWRAPADRLVPALNRHMPRDVSVLTCRETLFTFHAQRHAIAKRYRYRIRSAQSPDPFHSLYHWRVVWPLDVRAMEQASRYLLGEHDFASFQSHGSPRKSTVRTIRDFVFSSIDVLSGQDLSIVIEANGFLYNMVRNIVGTLMEIGRGKLPPEVMKEILETRNRKAAGETAPAHGLCLIHVFYDDYWFLDQYDTSGNS